jgi:membrane dipeptidase
MQQVDNLQIPVPDLLADTLVWDNHGCMPLRPDDESFLPQLVRYRQSGFDVVSLNVAFDGMSWDNCVPVLASFRSWIRRHSEEFVLVNSIDDIQAAIDSNRLAITFDIEGGNALNGNIKLVELYYDLGVRWMLMAYNKNNLLGGGCQDEDSGLSEFGKRVLVEMARVGMVICCSHTGYRTTMDIMEFSQGPVIFSHSNPLGVWNHPRNIRDDAIRACAESDGVIGINGINSFLGDNDISTETFVRHIDYVVQLVGPRHVGISLDYVFDKSEGDEYVANNPDIFPLEDGYVAGLVEIIPPERLTEIAISLRNLGYSDDDLRAILGGNFLRVAQAVWK